MQKYLEKLRLNKKIELNDLIYLIENIKDCNHFFKINKLDEKYLIKLLKYINLTVSHILNKNDYINFFISKLQFGRDKFNKNQFFQNLSELVVAGGMFELIKEYPDIYSSFKYERKFGGKKDVDFSFYWKTHECDINIEVKCPDYDEEMDYYNKEVLWGRVPYFDNTLHITRRDRKAISYIKNAHDKVNGSKESDINILVVCTSGIIDQAEWVNYYIKNKDKKSSGGVLMDGETYGIKESDYENIDFIIITDVFYRLKNCMHMDFFNFNQCHNFLFPNDQSKKNKEVLKGLTESELIEIKKINNEKDYLELDQKYPLLRRYFDISNLFNNASTEYMNFFQEHSLYYHNYNWILPAFIFYKEIKLMYPFVKVKILDDYPDCIENKYSDITELNRQKLIDCFESQNLNLAVDNSYDNFFYFLNTLSNDFISTLGCEENIHKIFISDEYCEFNTFLEFGINMFKFKQENEKNTPFKIIF